MKIEIYARLLTCGAAWLLTCPTLAAETGVVVCWGTETMPYVAPGTYFTAIAAGGSHSLWLKSDGTVVAQGQNYYGQSKVPTGLTGVIAIAAGNYHSLALKYDGTVVAWGYNYNGEIIVPSGLRSVVAVAAGSSYNLALKSDGTVVAWGNGNYGGNVVPIELSNVIAIAACADHSLALKSDGTVVAWGSNSWGESTVPSGLNDVIAIAAGSNHSLALKSDGTVVAWGSNYNGESSTVPSGLSDVIAIAAGSNHSLALKSDGTVVAWGYNYNGDSIVPSGLNGVVAVAAGESYSLALKSDGTVVGWGIYDGAVVPIPAGVLKDIVSIAAGSDNNLALKSDGTVVGWGYIFSFCTVPSALSNVAAIATGNYYNSLALKSDGTVVVWCPTPVPDGLNDVIAIAAGGSHSLALKNDRTVVAWGSDYYGQITVPSGLNDVVGIAAGGDHSLALKSDGTVVAWGDNQHDQTTVPSGLHNVIAIAAGGDHSLALKSDGTVAPWGKIWDGNWDGTNQYVNETLPNGFGGVSAVAAGITHSLAIKSNGTVVAWGNNDYGQTTVPAGLHNVIAIAAGDSRSLALVRDEGVVAQSPVIVMQPSSHAAQVGNTVIFSIAVTGTAQLNYQWRKNGVNIPNANNYKLTLNSVSAADSGGYSVVVWNAYGSVVSDTAYLTVSQPLILTPTSLIPTTAQSTPALLVSCPISPSELKVFANGSFVTAGALDPAKKTIVLTHGWIPSVGPVSLTEGLNGWPLDFAITLVANGVGANANIVAWDWDCAAMSLACDPSKAAGNTQNQGRGLAQALSDALGAGYSQQIHFIGHSLGTLVNARAANSLHAGGFDSSKTQMTLFDEASVATFTDCLKLLWLATDGRPSNSQNYLQPLPTDFSWADNYISLVGNLQKGAVNVILTNGLPATATGILNLIGKAANFHAYPGYWYNETINTDISAMGHRWSFERGGFSGAPTADKVFIQADNGSEWNLAETLDRDNWFDQRYKAYHKAVATAGAQTISDGLSHGNVFGFSVYGAPANVNIVLRLITAVGGSVLPLSPRPLGGGSGVTNMPAYAWIPMTVPSNSISMSFDFMLEGNGQDDSFAVALNGTNILSVEAGFLQTNVTFNSGLIDVADYAGKQVELFFGLVGGTSTNASVTVSNVQFFIAQPPVLQAQLADTSIVLSWPLSIQDFSLQSTTNLLDINSWATLTNEPAIVDLQNTVTNSISGGARFYRLTK